ncbi:MAG TPA: hypothetical protein PLB90_09595 [Opitutaceae bacterium]|nr:hypothetical protein [Opitutaceae bacterium]
MALTMAGFGLLLAAGCMTPPADDPSRVGPFFTPTNHVGDPALPPTMRRVVLLPLAGGSVAPAESLAALDPVMAAALLHQHRFEVVALTRDDCRRLLGSEELSSVAVLPANLMANLRREYAADGVMFVDVTSFSAYRPIAIGLRAKLATTQDVRLVWTFDTVFSSADPAVANSARHAALETSRKDVPADLTPAVLLSPGKFAGYAAEAMFQTLPPIAVPPPAASEVPAR